MYCLVFCMLMQMIHENILNSPIPVEAGDVLSILFKADNAANYIPLLYNVTGSGGLVSYYRTARGSPPGDVFTLTANGVSQDTLFPLISLEMCKSNLTVTVYTVHQSVVSKVTIYTACTVEMNCSLTI